tara:strand:+ start:2759 stop:4333 length:1575 start_codon:yes stop_codon:yes gene_type:complete
LHSTGKYEIAELGSYGVPNDPRAKDIPWKFYGVMPHESDPKNIQDQYNQTPQNQFGEFRFEETCLDFEPDIVCDIRDFWMLEYQQRSPFRDFFKWCIMPTVDAMPQARQWIATYSSADACLTYSDWAGQVLKNQAGDKINYLGSSPPSAHSAYQPIDSRDELRKACGIPVDAKIIGTVMRNQRRKLYPDLFQSFRKLLDSVEDPRNYFLYCHTSYPDMGWDIPELIHQNKLSSNILFTYMCNDTGRPFPSLFKGAIAESPFSGKFSATLSNVKKGAKYEELSRIINLFDIYIQYANSEGFGLPQVEAAACGVPVMGTDYSAMETVIRKLEGIPLKPKALYKELETGCMRAVPDNDLTAEKLKEFFDKPQAIRMQMGFNTRQKFLEHFQWDKSGKKWEDYFDSVEVRPLESTWRSPPRFRKPQPKPDLEKIKNVSHSQLAKFLISEVLCDPSQLNTHMEARLTRDLLYRTTTSSVAGMYFNESSAAYDGANIRNNFDFNSAYNHFVQLCNRHNHWENIRVEKNLK